MMNLKLFSNLQGDAVSSLILQPEKPGQLRYFVVAQTVNFVAVTSGTCEGELPSNDPKSFDVVLTSIMPLIDKNYHFRLTYRGGKLLFTEVDKGFTVSVLHVEKISDFAITAISKFLESSESLSRYVELSEKLEQKENEVRYLQSEYNRDKILALSGEVTSSNPFDLGESKSEKAVEEHFSAKLKEAKADLDALKSDLPEISKLNMDGLKTITGIAARNNTIVSMCGDCAIVEIPPAYVIQKTDCSMLAIQGKLLQRLLSESGGEFFSFKDEILFNVDSGKGRDRTVTRIFLTSYLPSTKIDSTLVTKGAVLEKYNLKLKGILKILSSVSSKFNVMKLDMGSSTLELANDRGENIEYKFEISDAKTVELNKLLRGEKVGDITMSTVEVPIVVQKIMPYLQDDFIAYVKRRKVIFKSDSLYVVFGR